MKNQTILGFALLAALGFASCSNEEPTSVADENGKIKITSLGFGDSRSTNQELQSVQIAQGVKVGVFVTDGTSCIENGDNNMLVADGAGQFVSTADMYWPASKSASIYAYAPYNSNWATGLSETQTFTVQSDQSTDENYLASDLLYGTPVSNPVSVTETAVPVKFIHKLVKIKVNIKSDAPESLRGATISLVNVCNEVSINLTTGQLGTATGSTEIVAARYAADATEFGCAAVIAPQTLASATPFINIVKQDGSAVSCKLPAPMTLASGKVYTFTVTLGDVSKVETDSELDNWEDGDNTDVSGDSAVTYGVGDFVLTDGTFIKKSDASKYEEAQIAGVIFSTTVSATDAAAGYKGYILGKTTQGNVKWAAESSFGYPDDYSIAPRSIAGAAECLDGRTETAYLKALDNFDETNFPWAKQLASITPLPEANFSEWYVPAMGQLLQIANNLGNANIDTTLSTIYWESFPKATDEELAQSVSGITLVRGIERQQIIDNLNKAIGKEVFTNRVYVSTSVYGNIRNNVWCLAFVEVNNNKVSVADLTESWLIQHASKNQGRGWIYVAAYK